MGAPDQRETRPRPGWQVRRPGLSRQFSISAKLGSAYLIPPWILKAKGSGQGFVLWRGPERDLVEVALSLPSPLQTADQPGSGVGGAK